MRARAFHLLIALSLLAVPAVAEIHPLSSPFRVNRTDDFKQLNPMAAFASANTVLVVWENDQNGIRGLFQRLDGTAASGQLTLVASDALGDRSEGLVVSRRDPALAFLPSGEFLLAWTEERAYVRASPFFEERQIREKDVFIQRFSSSGTPAGARARVNNDAAGFQTVPKIAILPNGKTVVLWKSTIPAATPQGGIAGRLVDATGQPLGADFKVSSDPTADHVVVAAGRNGFLVAWDSVVGDQVDVFARLYESSGRSSGSAFRVNSSPTGMQRYPTVATGGDGNFLVAWQNFVSKGAGVHIQGQFLSPAGGFLGASFLISSDQGLQGTPALGATKTGFLASWLEANHLGWGIRAVELTTLGARLGDEFQVVDYRVRKNLRPSIAADGKGGFLIPWESELSRRPTIMARGLRQ